MEIKILVEIPRYVRVNTLVTTLDAVIEWLCNEGFREAYYYQSDGDYVHEKFIERVKRLRRYEFMKDLHVENLLIFHSKQSFYNHDLYNGGSIILQDKASCFPVLCLKPRPGKLVIDACAAPGMKTTLIASLMNNKGCIFALDRSSYRVETMVDILRVTNVTCADVQVTDFLNINPQELPYRKVRYILLDPSCSCSGIVSERQRAGEDAYDVSIERLKALATFQLALLKHALSFPKVKRVVYSTCSIYETENEDVIMEALKEFDDRFFFPEVKVGWPALEGATGDYSSLNGHCLKTIPARDLTNGFFVAVFHRRKKMSGEEK